MPLIFIGLLRPDCCWRRCSGRSSSSSPCAATCSQLNPVAGEQRGRVRRHERRPERDGHRASRWSRPPPRKSSEQAKFDAARAPASATSSSSEGQIEARYLPLLLFGVRDRARPSLHGAWLLSRGRDHGRRAGRLHGPDGAAALPGLYLDLYVLAGADGLASAGAHPELIKAEEPSWTRTTAGMPHRSSGEIVFENVSFGYGGWAGAARHLLPAGRARRSRSSARPARARPR